MMWVRRMGCGEVGGEATVLYARGEDVRECERRVGLSPSPPSAG